MIAAAGVADARQLTLSVANANVVALRLYERLGFGVCSTSNDGLNTLMALDLA